ncbi:SAM-dependent methyltransferase [Streptacidiphilus sp. EB103A]|uniref:SAM-dependent methyltransferase n=1 Tax=Streptacidiphilus sp. EB103A TaxID=3156275 RepID=UPI0035114CD6
MSSQERDFPSIDPKGSPPELDVTIPHSARMWNYWLGGKDNYAADRQAAEQVMAVFPGIVDVARASRALLARVVAYLAAEAGVRQFLDIGTGLPTADNTHEVAQAIAPQSRIVYADNDPLVLVHARALLTSSPEGATAYIDADVRDPDTILAEAAKTLDFTQPVALVMLGILGNVPDYEQAQAIVKRLVDAVPSGSYLVVNDGTDTSTERVQATDRHNEGGVATYFNRSPAQIAGYFQGLDLLEPGVVSASRWRPEPNPFGEPPIVDAYCAVARKP